MESPTVSEGIITIRILFIILPILMGTIHCIWRRDVPSFSKVECFFVYFLVIGVGLQRLLVGHLEIYHKDLVAAYIGWPSSLFLSEVGKANIAFGILGILSFWFNGGWREATALGNGLFLLMVGIGHLRYNISHLYFYKEIPALLIATDFIIAGVLFTLLILRRFSKA